MKKYRFFLAVVLLLLVVHVACAQSVTADSMFHTVANNTPNSQRCPSLAPSISVFITGNLSEYVQGQTLSIYKDVCNIDGSLPIQVSLINAATGKRFFLGNSTVSRPKPWFHHDEFTLPSSIPYGKYSISIKVVSNKSTNNIEAISDAFNIREAYSFSVAPKNSKPSTIVAGIDEAKGSTYYWSSVDGVIWSKLSKAKPWGDVVFLNNKFYLIDHSNVYTSVNGISWEKVDTNPNKAGVQGVPWRSHHNDALVVYNNRLWMFNYVTEHDPLGTVNEIWSSPDGATWTQMKSDPLPFTYEYPFTFNFYHPVFVFKDKLWVVDAERVKGFNTPHYFMQTSVDGVHWIRKPDSTLPSSYAWKEVEKNNPTQTPAVPAQTMHDSVENKTWDFSAPYSEGGNLSSIFTWNGKVWLLLDTEFSTPVPSLTGSPSAQEIAKYNATYRDNLKLHMINSIWSSVDGIHWSQELAATPWSGRYNYSTYVYKNKLFVVGGQPEGEGLQYDVWSSDDGVNWTKVTDKLPFDAYYGVGVSATQ